MQPSTRLLTVESWGPRLLDKGMWTLKHVLVLVDPFRRLLLAVFPGPDRLKRQPAANANLVLESQLFDISAKKPWP